MAQIQNLASNMFLPMVLHRAKEMGLALGGLALIKKSGLFDSIMGKNSESSQNEGLKEKGIRYGMAALGVAATAWGIYSMLQSPASTIIPPLPSTNICDILPRECEGNLGIRREIMPQLEGSVKENFLNAHTHSCALINAKKLTPIQNEGNWEKIQGMINATLSGVWDACKSPIITTQDDYILDGHHRAFACSILGRDISAFKLDQLSSRAALETANNFSGVEHHSFSFSAR